MIRGNCFGRIVCYDHSNLVNFQCILYISQRDLIFVMFLYALRDRRKKCAQVKFSILYRSAESIKEQNYI